MLKKIAKIFLLLMVFALPIFLVIAGNILSGNSSANLEIDDSNVYFFCNGCDVSVTDTDVNGLIWGPSLGWVNLQPGDGGVSNTRLGVVSGNAWGAISGWINFTGVFIDPDTGEFSGQAFSQNRGPIVFECPGSNCVVTSWRPQGCTYPLSSNYDSTATQDDGSCETPSNPQVPGCTDSNALNYNSNATIDDGSCTFPQPVNPGGGGGGGSQNPSQPQPVPGCTNSLATNYNPSATVDNGSCTFNTTVVGCMNPTALNYNHLATVDGGNCIYPEPEGCTDPSALNYNQAAISDNGTCTYPQPENSEEGNSPTNPGEENPNPENPNFFPPIDIENPGSSNQNPNENIPTNPSEENPIQENNNPPLSESINIKIVDILEKGKDIVQNLFNNLPGSLGEMVQKVSTFITENEDVAKTVTFTALVASLVRTVPFGELNLLFSIFGIYKTRRYWGTVYDSVTKQPLDPAYVTLFDQAGQAVDTSITDIDGRYSFVAPPGKYFLSAQKTDYMFPSQKLLGKNYDELYPHLYFGGEVVIQGEDDVISRNIPMDPLRFNWNEYAKQKTHVTHFYKPWHRTLNFISKLLFFFGFIFSIWVFAISPKILALVILSLYVLTMILKSLGFMRAIPRGYVKDKNGFAISFGIIRVYSETLNREVKHTVIGSGGYYLLLVPNGKYSIAVEQKLEDGSYQEIYRSEAFRVSRGYIAKKITVPHTVVSKEEKFDSLFKMQKPII